MKRKSIKQKIKELFFTNPTIQLRVRQIEKRLKVPLPSVIRYCGELEGEGILQKEKFANIQVYSADRAARNFLIEKKLFNIKQLYDSSIIDFLKSEYSNPVIVVFGSYSRGEDVEDSDIDLYIETQKRYEFHLERFENILRRKIQVFSFANVNKVPNKHLSNNIINGVVLNSFMEVFK